MPCENEKTPSEIVGELLDMNVLNKIGNQKKYAKKDSLKNIMIGARIRAARLYNEWEQTDLAKKMKTQQKVISQLESGKGEPRQSTIEKIAELTGFEWQWFYKD